MSGQPAQLVIDQGQHLIDHSFVPVTEVDQELSNTLGVVFRHRTIVTFDNSCRNPRSCTLQPSIS
jgi:hypothetical protein